MIPRRLRGGENRGTETFPLALTRDMPRLSGKGEQAA
jgi:hypothetical protein